MVSQSREVLCDRCIISLPEPTTADAKLRRSRVWIIQEVTLAKHVMVICGDAMIEWNMLMTGTIACLKRPWAELFIDLATAHYARVLCLAREAVINNQDDSSRLLLHLVSQCRWSRATNPRDKIYGLLGLASVGSNRTAVKVDYSQRVENCYRAAVLDMIRASGSLEILQLCRKPPGLRAQDRDEDFDLPSWVPDLSLDTSDFQAATNLSWLSPFGLQSAVGMKEVFSRHPHLKAQMFCASKESVEHDLRCDDDRTLNVSGMMIDTISEVEGMLAGLEAQENSRGLAQFDYIREVRARTHTPWKYLKSTLTSLRGFVKTQYDNGTDKLLLVSWRRLALSRGMEYPTGETTARAFSATLHRGWLGEDPEKRLAQHDAEWRRVLGRLESFDRRLLAKNFSRQSKFRRAVVSLFWSFMIFFRSMEILAEAYASKCYLK